MHRYESWTIKKIERQRIDTFELWCWRRILRVPCTSRSSQSTLKEIYPEYSLEGLMLKLKLQYFGHLMKMKVKVSEVAQSCPTLCYPMTIAYQASPSMGLSRQEYWSGLPFPSPEDLPNSGIEPRSPAL